jgi:hypothetical protein
VPRKYCNRQRFNFPWQASTAKKNIRTAKVIAFLGNRRPSKKCSNSQGYYNFLWQSSTAKGSYSLGNHQQPRKINYLAVLKCHGKQFGLAA